MFSHPKNGRVGGLEPVPAAPPDETLQGQRARGEEHGVGGGEEVELRVLDREEDEEEDVDQTQRTERPPIPGEQVIVEASEPERQGERLHRQHLLDEELYRRGGGHPLPLRPPQLERGPAVRYLPDNVRKEED